MVEGVGVGKGGGSTGYLYGLCYIKSERIKGRTRVERQRMGGWMEG